MIGKTTGREPTLPTSEPCYSLTAVTRAKTSDSDVKSPEAGALGLSSASRLMPSFSSADPDSRKAPTTCWCRAGAGQGGQHPVSGSTD